MVHFVHILQCVHIEFHALQMCFAGVYIWEWDYTSKRKLNAKPQAEHVLCAISKSMEKKLEINVGILKQLFEKFKYGIRITVDHMVLESLVKTCQILFRLITQELLGLLKF